MKGLGFEVEAKMKMRSVVRFAISVAILTLIITIVCLLMLKYSVEGENNMPFELTQLIAVSTAEGIDAERRKHMEFRLSSKQ